MLRRSKPRDTNFKVKIIKTAKLLHWKGWTILHPKRNINQINLGRKFWINSRNVGRDYKRIPGKYAKFNRRHDRGNYKMYEKSNEFFEGANPCQN
jgi:hypothetical protein